jgi:hypothetical protein
MKKLSVFITAVLLISSASLQLINAQQSESDKEKEKKIQMEIEQQKKAMSEQYKAQEEALKAAQEAQKEIEKSMQDMKIEVITEDFEGGDEGDFFRVYGRRGDRSFRIDEPMVWSSASPGNVHAFAFSDNSQMTRWDFSKNVKESNFSKEYGFDVEKTSKSVVMSVNGDCKDGEIRIKITMPNGKTYSEILIDESGSLNWRKSFSISETENLDKAGEWKFQISASKATGYFKISLQTN